MNIKASTLRPGLLVSFKTSIRGNVSYDKRDIETEHKTASGKSKAKWETERTIADPEEYEAAVKVRTKIQGVVRRICTDSAFGMLCREDNEPALNAAIEEAYRLAEEFNSSAALTRVSFGIMKGRIAADDVEAVKAINSEVRGLMRDMEDGIRNMDPAAIRAAAQKARDVGNMLTPQTAASLRIAIDASREAARKITKAVKAGEQAAYEVDQAAIRQITEQRVAFLDLGEQGEIESPSITGRALDLAPETGVAVPNVASPSLEM